VAVVPKKWPKQESSRTSQVFYVGKTYPAPKEVVDIASGGLTFKKNLLFIYLMPEFMDTLEFVYVTTLWT
jgi:hypothetical protein